MRNSEARRLEFGQRRRERLALGVAVDVDEEHVVPLLLARRARLDARHADAVLGQRLEQAVERAGCIGLRGRDEQRGLVGTRSGFAALRPITRKRVVLSGLVLDLGHQQVEPVHLRRRRTGDRGGALLVPGAARAFRVAADRHAFDARHVLLQPAAALRERLRMPADAADVAEHGHAAHQVLVDAQLDLADDLERRGQEHVERVVDRAFGRVLDRHDAEIGGAGFHLVEDFLHGRERQRPHRVPEVLEHRLLRERALGAEVADLQRVLLRQAGGHDLAEQAQDFLVAQRAVLVLVALQRQAQHLRLALRAVEVDRVARGVLRHADLLREVRALVDQRVQLRVDAVDPLADLLERHLLFFSRRPAPAGEVGRRPGEGSSAWSLGFGLFAAFFLRAAMVTPVGRSARREWRAASRARPAESARRYRSACRRCRRATC